MEIMKIVFFLMIQIQILMPIQIPQYKLFILIVMAIYTPIEFIMLFGMTMLNIGHIMTVKHLMAELFVKMAMIQSVFLLKDYNRAQ